MVIIVTESKGGFVTYVNVLFRGKIPLANKNKSKPGSGGGSLKATPQDNYPNKAVTAEPRFIA
jgi:hypothetical protein